MRAKVFGSLLCDISAVFDGLVITSCLIVGEAKSDHKNDILWIVRAQAQSLIKMFHRWLGLTIERKCVAKKSVRSSKIRIEVKCSLKCVHSRIGLFAHCGELTKCKMGPWIASV